MTNHRNASLLQQSYRAVERGDLQPMLGMLSEDVTWTDSTLGPLAGTYTKDEVPRFFAEMADIYGGTLRVEITSIVASDDHAIVLTQESGTICGEPLAWSGVHVYTFTQGRVTGFASYGSAEYQQFWAGKHATVTS